MTHEFIPGVPMGGHVTISGYWHPGPIVGCQKCPPRRARRPSRPPQVYAPCPFHEGDRIKVIGRMTEDPNPLEIGLTGTVLYVANAGTTLEQLHVEWDRDSEGVRRTLLLLPADYRIVRRLDEGEA